MSNDKVNYEESIECEVLDTCSTKVIVREIRAMKQTLAFMKANTDTFKDVVIWREESGDDPSCVSVESMIDFYVDGEWVARKFVWTDFHLDFDTLEFYAD